MRVEAVLTSVVVLLSGVLVPTARAGTADVPPEAQRARDAAVAAARVGHWADARRQLDEAASKAPQWPEPYFLRAGVLLALAGGDSLALPAAPDAVTDYGALAALLEAAVADLGRYLELQPGAPDRAQAQEVAAKLAGLGKRARDLAAEQRRQRDLRDEAERQRKAAEQAAAAAAAQAAIEAEVGRLRQQDDEAAAERASGRATGFTLLGLGGLPAGAAVAFALLGNQTNLDIQQGGLKTSKAITDRASDGASFNIATWIAIGVAGAMVTAGVITVLAQPPPPPFDEQAARAKARASTEVR